MIAWRRHDLAEMVDRIESGRRPKGGASQESGTVPSLGGENIKQSGGLDLSSVRTIPSEFYCRMKTGALRPLDVLINKDGANTGKTGIYEGQFPIACINEHVFLLRGKQDRIDQRYLYYLLVSHAGQAIISKKISGSAQPGLKSDFLTAFPVVLPDGIAAQGKIAAVISAVDAAIEQTKARVDKLQRIKTGLVHDLLTRGIDESGQLRDPATHRFTDSAIGRIPAGRAVTTLGEQINLQRGFDITESQISPGNIPVVSSSGISYFHKHAMAKGPGVITGRKGTIGKVFYVEGDYWPHDTTLWVTDFRGNAPKFVAFYLLSLELQRLDYSTATPTLNRNFLHPTLVAFPPRSEQEQIVAVLSEADIVIDQKSSHLSKLRLLKAGLMQDLLSGNVSVEPLLEKTGDNGIPHAAGGE